MLCTGRVVCAMYFKVCLVGWYAGGWGGYVGGSVYVFGWGGMGGYLFVSEG